MLFFDFEVFQKNWLMVAIDDNHKQYIVSTRDELKALYDKHSGDIWVGYNCKHYDQYIFKAILLGLDPQDVSDHIIKWGCKGYTYSRQFKTLKLNIYDVAKLDDHGLKTLEGHRGRDIIEFDFGIRFEYENVKNYCIEDVLATKEVFIQRFDEFNAQLLLLKDFGLPLSYLCKTKAQLTSIILGAKKIKRNDEFDITIPECLDLKKYKNLIEIYQKNKSYNFKYNTTIAGIPHTLGFGGLHGCRDNYKEEGIFLHIDVSSFYPSLIVNHNLLSRNVADPSKYQQLIAKRLQYKQEDNPLADVYKIIINSTYGCMKHEDNDLYDPRQANNVCIHGQLLLIDLIEKLEHNCELIQSNTDGIIIKKPRRAYDGQWQRQIVAICANWCNRTKLKLDINQYEKIYQRDVNNYIIIDRGKNYKAKGLYFKPLTKLSYNLAIVQKAIINYLVNNISIDVTIDLCDELIEYQQIVKVTNNFQYATHGDKPLPGKVFRVFASNKISNPGIFKIKLGKPHKFEYTPEHCFIDNGDIIGKKIPPNLNKTWYKNIAKKRLNEFLRGDKVALF